MVIVPIKILGLRTNQIRVIRSWMGIIVETKEQTSDKHKHNIGQNETMPGFVGILTTLR